jgi:hypothetical protein
VVVKTDLSKNRCQQSCRACRSCTVAVSVRLTLPFIEVRFLYEDSLDLSIYRVKLISGVVAFFGMVVPTWVEMASNGYMLRMAARWECCC